MATTTNYSWTTPDDTDLVKDGAAAIRTLGSSADTTVKNLNPGTTAGDIDYYTSGTAKARIAIGTAGQVLQVNAGATAPEWAALNIPVSGLELITPTSTANTGGTVTTTGGLVEAAGVSTFSLNGVFSSSYDNYIIKISDIIGTATANLYMRARASSSDTTTGYFFVTPKFIFTSGSITVDNSPSGTSVFYVGEFDSTRTVSSTVNIFSPNRAKETTTEASYVMNDGGANAWSQLRDTTAYDGITIYPSSGDLSCRVRVYGLAN